MKNTSCLLSRGLSALFCATALVSSQAIAEADYPFEEGYEELEYVDTGYTNVEGVGRRGAYFDSGVPGQYEVKIETKILAHESFNKLGEGWQWLIGSCAKAEDKTYFGRMEPLYFNFGRACVGARYRYTGSVLNIGEEYEIEASTGARGDESGLSLTINGDPVTLTKDETTADLKDFSEEQADNGYTMFVGNSNEAGAHFNPFDGRIYYLKIWVKDELVRNYVPCRNPDGVVGMWDRVNGTFTASIDALHPFLAPEDPSEDPIQDAIDKGAGVILSEYPEDGEIADEGATFMHDGKIWSVKNGGYIFVETDGRLEQVIKEPVISGFDNSAEGKGFVLTVDSFEGFTYYLISADNVQFNEQATDESKDGTGEALTFETKPNGEKRFYKLSVSETK